MIKAEVWGYGPKESHIEARCEVVYEGNTNEVAQDLVIVIAEAVGQMNGSEARKTIDRVKEILDSPLFLLAVASAHLKHTMKGATDGGSD